LGSHHHVGHAVRNCQKSVPAATAAAAAVTTTAAGCTRRRPPPYDREIKIMPYEADNDGGNDGENNTSRGASDSEAIRRLKRRLSKFETEEGRLSGLSYVSQSRDEVFITSSPKSGTTWLQQICHQLRSGPKGDMTFSEISEVVPWLELAHDQGQVLTDAQYGHDDNLPRLFKTHAWEPHCPKGGKRIVIVRNPYDVSLSFFHFFENWFFDGGEVSVSEFVREFWLARGVPASRMNNASYFHHLLSWWRVREEEDVLFLFFEDLKEDLTGVVRRIAGFISTDEHDFTDEEIIRGAVDRSSFEFMSKHKGHFDEKLSKLARNEACGLRPDAGMSATKLNRGESGLGKEKLPEDVRKEISEKWVSVVTPVTGYGSYDELRRAVSKHVVKTEE